MSVSQSVVQHVSGGALESAAVSGGSASLQAVGDLVVSGELTMSSNGTLTMYSSQDVVLNHNVNGGSATLISPTGGASIYQAAGTRITASSIDLITYGTDIGSASAPVEVRALSKIGLRTTGGGSAYVNEQGTTTLYNSKIHGDLYLTTGGGMTVWNVSTTEGSIELTANGGALTVYSGKSVVANEGNVVLRNNNTTSGMIVLQKGATVEAYTQDVRPSRWAT